LLIKKRVFATFLFTFSSKETSKMPSFPSTKPLDFQPAMPFTVEDLFGHVHVHREHPVRVFPLNVFQVDHAQRKAKEHQPNDVVWFTLVTEDTLESGPLQYVLQCRVSELYLRSNATRSTDGGSFGLPTWVFRKMHQNVEPRPKITKKEPKKQILTDDEMASRLATSVHVNSFTQPGGPSRKDCLQKLTEFAEIKDSLGQKAVTSAQTPKRVRDLDDSTPPSAARTTV